MHTAAHRRCTSARTPPHTLAEYWWARRATTGLILLELLAQHAQAAPAHRAPVINLHAYMNMAAAKDGTWDVTAYHGDSRCPTPQTRVRTQYLRRAR